MEFICWLWDDIDMFWLVWYSFSLKELMLLGLISLLLAQWAREISMICVNSSLFSSKFYICSEKDYGIDKNLLSESTTTNESFTPSKDIFYQPHHCGVVRFFSYHLNSVTHYVAWYSCWSALLTEGSRAFCIIWGSWAASPIFVCPWYHSCSIQLLGSCSGHEQGTLIFLIPWDDLDSVFKCINLSLSLPNTFCLSFHWKN